MESFSIYYSDSSDYKKDVKFMYIGISRINGDILLDRISDDAPDSMYNQMLYKAPDISVSKIDFDSKFISEAEYVRRNKIEKIKSILE